MYIELSEKIERVSKILFFLTKISYVGTNIPASLITLFSYFVLDLKKESFFLPYPTMYDPRKGKLKPWPPFNKINTKSDVDDQNDFLFCRLPFDWKTPFGYVLASVFFAGAIYCLLFGIIPVVCLFVGSCWLFISFAKDMTNEISKLNASAKTKNYRELKKRFPKLIQMHVDVKKLSESFVVPHIVSCNIYNRLCFLFLENNQCCRWIRNNFRIHSPLRIHMDTANGLFVVARITRPISWVYKNQTSYQSLLISKLFNFYLSLIQTRSNLSW